MLAKGTLVTMLDGSKKEIQDIKAGDRLLGKDGIVRVIGIEEKVIDKVFQITLENGNELSASYEQPILSAERYLALQAIEPSTVAVVYIEELSKVKRVKPHPANTVASIQKVTGYQLETRDSLPYYANGIVVGDYNIEGSGNV